MELIDKDKVVEKINSVLDSYDPNEITSGRYELVKLRNFLDTLKVKEMDFENYIHGTIDYPIIGSDFPNIYPNYKELKDYCIRHCIKDNDKVKIIIVKEE